MAAKRPSKKSTAKKSTAKKSTAKKSTAKKSTAKKSTAKKSTAKKSTAKKSTAKKSTAKKSTAKKSTAKKSTAKKSTAKKSTAKKSAATKQAARVPGPGGNAAIDPIELYDERDGAPDGELHTAIVPMRTGAPRPVEYEIIDGYAVVESDIILGTVEQVERDSQIIKAEMRGQVARGVIISGDQFRWPDCVVPYRIDSDLPDKARVTDAIAHWEEKTQFTFVKRTSSNASQYPDYITFRTASGCSSSVGRRGGQQFINLGDGCTTGNTIHEIGHAVGLWHEQSREDRDAFVTINWANIKSGKQHNFNQHITDGDDVGDYDYASIMHYPRKAFSKNNQETITPVQPGADIGQREGLSAGDIAAINSMCAPVGTGVETAKETVETTKELAPETTKERFPETAKELAPETTKERAPEPPVTWVEHLGPGWGGFLERLFSWRAWDAPGGGAVPFSGRASDHGVGDPASAAAPTDEQIAAALRAQVEMLAQAVTAHQAEEQAIAQAYEAAVAQLAALEGE